ncbi:MULTISPECIES: AMP-binding protein [unclassified Pseudonocardia]|uniref:class I adenylate-forming enzyme family protein n=1 Tax=unclassified Pseudonocardia TaxID=2619320 RepID=UPI0009639726|nr:MULTISPECIES: AMP-binding protein [unclassified Pseudonocardia]MBN9100937.1 AMP-binding protein [Pseudonocardia sp.]OJY39404.1 MAG: long-chain fatty acid--CoA ligase [Pseudonocardia sp. 73-21]
MTTPRSEWLPETDVPLVEGTVGGLLVEQAKHHPDVVALIGTSHAGEDRRWTYAELLDAARHAAGSLLTVADPGDHVALWAPNVAEWPIVQYAAALAGVTLVALNPALRPAELEYCLRLSQASVLVHADRARTYDMAAVVAEVAPTIPDRLEVISLSDAGRLHGSPVQPEELSSPESPAMIQFTSGTTGHPKAVLLSHRSLVNNARLTMLTAEVEPGAVAIAPLPSFHTAGCVISHLGPAVLGGTMVLISTFDPSAVLRAMTEHGASVLFGVPTVLAAVLQAARASSNPVPQLATVLVGASTVPGSMIEAVEQTFGASVHNLYGQTELSPVMCLTRRSDTREDLVTSVGRPLPHTGARIVDPVTGAVQPLGVAGEVCARGYNQMISYFDDPEATAATVDAEGWLHTGDLGSMDARGLITLSGRLKELIIRGGENISPAEIEIALAAHPAVAESAVVGLPDETWGEIVAAVVTTHGPAAPDLERQLTEHCLSRLTPFKVPVRWFFRDELPHTASGKVQKFVLRDELTARSS